MTRREGAWLGAGLVLAAGAAALALHAGHGTIDTDAPAPPERGGGDGPAAGKGYPPLRIPAGTPRSLADFLERTHGQIPLGGAAEEKVLGRLADGAREPPLAGGEARALEALGPALEWVVLERTEGPATLALRGAAALALEGKGPAREALHRSGLVRRAFAFAAATGSPALRAEAARLLGVVGGPDAVDRLVIMVRDREEVVVEAAVRALAMTGDRKGVLPTVEACDRPGTSPAIRRACLESFRVAPRLYRPAYAPEREAAALLDPDPATRLQAARNVADNPSTVALPALPGLLDDPDPEIRACAADALAGLKEAPARPALEKRLAVEKDERVLRALRRAIDSLPPPK